LVSDTDPLGSHRSLRDITTRYDRLARFYRFLEPLYLIFAPARRKAVNALRLRPGDVVLEIGAGTGRNLQYLTREVGKGGAVIAVDASPGMLAQAKRLVTEHAWQNVELVQQDAELLAVDRDLDGVLFSLSYSVIPHPSRALQAAWARLRPGGRVVIMDAGLPDSRLGRILGPITKFLVWVAPGNAYTHPWDDLRAYGTVETERFLLDIYFVCAVTKPT
jgi:phosphatidylethanolamine/phosphatidyl-N-methylethanolamine N-methyltransferase